MALLEVRNLKTYFYTRYGISRAVDDISFDIQKGETVGIVGESGSGKSVSCYSLLRLIAIPPGRIESGRAIFNGTDLLSCTRKELRKIRGNIISMVFQDSMSSLNPYLTIGIQLTEHLLLHKGISKFEAREKALSSLLEVGIQDPESRINQYPHQLSGGMRQRVMIAMALITGPLLLIADEPTTALDVTIQAQIIDLINDLKKRKDMSVIFITHDLGVVAGISDHVLVMYSGKIMESGETRDVYYKPIHPYTDALLKSIPSVEQKNKKLYVIPGHPPESFENIKGCVFASRCEYVQDKCVATIPELMEVSDGHYSSCLRIQEGTSLDGLKEGDS
ncbi:MAG TPA: ABC transporter ATP-binding protein [Desulfatiglandales bacterium]|nr:ABC transporter ATP-binding protein [Desulfatiglandales bacterium]